MSPPRPRRQGRPSPRRPSPDAAAHRPTRGSDRWIYGRHAVAAALSNPERRWRRLAVLAGQETEAQQLLATAVAERRGAEGGSLEVRDRDAFAALLPPGAVHQGLALEVEPLPEPELDDLLRELATAAGRCVVVALDQVSDPHNVGAVLRSASAFGARAVLVAAHGAPPITGALAKAASGAVDRVPLIRVVNLVRALDRLKEAGFWACGLDETADRAFAALDLGPRAVLVLGSEGGGIRRLVREHCDHLARLPTSAAQPTLNVSNAAAVALYELTRNTPPA
ncbi:MAG TPA: 23S rRNA (guanosine(2251)-2'-O)-methyltransferase RlmB [Stellaceae bacterium]|jgi:23S rRNA (guanosine2251-2'-O)-methyltransferase|nr:23S rRNA (guanosine(2251)-2'-O)-methyltransferase RlmB [Stellaceae bacterium]